AANPTVKTSDAGSNAVLVASADTGWIGYEAKAIGSAGNDITVEYVDAEPYSILIFSEVGNAISVELADDGIAPTSTESEVAGEISASALVTAAVEPEHGGDPVPVMSATALSGGSLEMLGKICPVTGELEITELLLLVDVTAIPDTSASMASYNIAFTTLPESVIEATDGTIIITFPAEYDISTVVAGLGADVTMTVDP
ncbi:unnamed protein product, partial [marine sediment metagenome]